MAGLLIRTGNFPVIPVPEWERDFRDWLGTAFGVRPRFKEFLIGHPLLLTGLFLKKRGAEFWSRVFLWGGIIGPVSVVNTFVHLETPIYIHFSRTFLGVALGLAVAIAPCLIVGKLNDKGKWE